MSSAILRAKLRRDLRHRRRQVIAVAVTVFIGVGLFVVSWGMYTNLRGSYDLTYRATNFADVWARGDQQVADALASADGVTAVETRVSADVAMRLGPQPITGRIQGLPTGTQPTINQLIILSGDYLDPADPDSVLIESHTADNFDLSVGDSIRLNRDGQWFEAHVVGIASSPEWLWLAPNSQELLTDPNEFGVVFASDALARQVAPEGSLQVVARVAGNDEGLAASAATVAYQAGASEVFDRAHHPSNQALQSDVKGFKQMAVLFPALFLAVAALATSVLLSRLIHTQRGEIAMLRAFGFDERQILRHFVSYGLATTMVGAVPAIVAGSFGARAATTAYTSFLSVPFTSQRLSPFTWLVALGFSLVLGAVSGYLPARAAARIEPAAAMRPIGPGVTGRRTFLEKFLPPNAPSWSVVAVRNIRRQPRRAASTMVGVMLALIIIVTAFVLNDSINSMFDRQFGEVDQRDLVVTLNDATTAEALRALSTVAGVAGAEPYGETAVLLRFDTMVSAQRLQAFVPATAAHDFTDVTSLDGDGIVLGSIARDELGVQVGDSVEATFPEFETSASIQVVGFVDEPIPGFSYVNVQRWNALTRTAPSMAVITLNDDTEHAQARLEVAALPGVLTVRDQVAIANQASALLKATRFFVGTMLIFAMVMAVALIFNAMTVSIGEREGEVATLQANGVGRSWIRRTITLENLVTVLGGVVPGLLLGRVLGALFLNQFSSPQFSFDAGIAWSSLAISVAIIAIAAVAAQFPGLRSLDKLDLAAKVRERNV